MLHIEHYSKTYPGGKKAVNDLTLHVGPGEIYGFIGHNGAGKTTTLRAVAGVMDFTEGTITIDGHDIKKDPVQAKRVTAFLPDNPDIYAFMKGIDYLNFIADLYDIPADQRTADIGKYSDAFELTDNLGSPIGSYSHGMRQKLALISAFIRRPRLLILDEPFVGLDPSAAHIMKGYLSELCQSGSAVFFLPMYWRWRKSCATRLPLSKRETGAKRLHGGAGGGFLPGKRIFRTGGRAMKIFCPVERQPPVYASFLNQFQGTQ